MPRQDGTGPQGQGPRTGRGQGPCMDRTPAAGTPAAPANGGRGRGRGRGNGQRGGQGSGCGPR